MEPTLFETVEQHNGFLYGRPGIPASQQRITTYQVFIKVSTMRQTYHILQAFLIRREALAEMRAIDINHSKMIAFVIMVTKEVRQIQIAMEDTSAMHQHHLTSYGLG